MEVAILYVSRKKLYMVKYNLRDVYILSTLSSFMDLDVEIVCLEGLNMNPTRGHVCHTSFGPNVWFTHRLRKEVQHIRTDFLRFGKVVIRMKDL